MALPFKAVNKRIDRELTILFQESLLFKVLVNLLTNLLSLGADLLSGKFETLLLSTNQLVLFTNLLSLRSLQTLLIILLLDTFSRNGDELFTILLLIIL